MAKYIQPESPQLEQLKTQLNETKRQLRTYIKDREHLIKIIQDSREIQEDYKGFIVAHGVLDEFVAWRVAKRMEH